MKVKTINAIFYFNKINSHLTFKNNIFCIKESAKKIKFTIPERSILFRKGLNYRLNYLYKKYFLDKIEFRKNDIVIDCGSNIGELFFLLKKKLKIRYIAFEPSPIVFKDLIKNTKSKKTTLYNLALFHKETKKKFYFLDRYADSSLIKIKNYTKIRTIYCTTLDKIVRNLKTKVKLIKIDAEGAEPEVLLGLKKYYSKVKYISVEAGFERGIKQLSTFKQCKKILKDKNFDLVYSNNIQKTYLFKNTNFK